MAKIVGVKPVYTGLNNGFAVYELEEPLAVSTEFFIGWEQFSVFNLNVGVDLDYRYFNDNEPNPNLYFNAAGSWENSKIVGTPLIRPVFGKDAQLSKNDVWLAPAFSVYPNPAQNMLSIELNEINDGQLSVFNLQGQEVLNRNIMSKQIQLDVSTLPNGMYLIRFENDNGEQMVKQFVKE